jgi:hypothetical protein
VHGDDFTVLLGDQPGFPPLDAVVKGYIDHAAVETAQTRVLQAAKAGNVAAATQQLATLHAPRGTRSRSAPSSK